MNTTIAAICTPPGEGGLAVLRLSGPKAFALANQIFSGNVNAYLSHTAHVGKIIDGNGSIIDEAVVLVMEEGRSFTGEATVEIMCHGSPLIARKILARLLEVGAVAAGPGEFSSRAYQNGKIDLAQAEAVQALIAAKNEASLRAAHAQLEGRLSKIIQELQKGLCDITAIVEAWVDYPEEGLEWSSEEALLSEIDVIVHKLIRLRDSFYDGKRLSDGISICLAGAPNAGKSSLMNVLVGEERAIVTDVAGTTRDVLSEEIYLGGHALRLYDTAGLRETDEAIEKEGIKRAQLTAEKSEIVVALYDISAPEEKLLFENAIHCWNKADLPHHSPPFDGIILSCKSGEGIEELKQAIHERIDSLTRKSGEEVVLTQERHYAAVCEAIDMVQAARALLDQGESPEYIVIDLRGALKALSCIVGIDITEEILGSIFEKFCVGK